MSVYIHIPFCSSICTYCDFCKFIYNKTWVNKYLVALEKEIRMRYKNDIINTIYIGGGTPSVLDIEQLNRLFKIVNIFKKDNELEFTFECNVENITKNKLNLLYKNGVNRLSIGVQTFNKNHLKYLNRNHDKEDVIKKIKWAKEIGFNNINIDLIYALKNQTLMDLKNDLEFFLSLDINHISTYSLIIEPNTKLYIQNEKNIDEDLDYEMYNLICKTLKDNGFIHYEISNFAKKGYESRHNLTYWNNNEYYGFGLGASGYIDNIRYDNTKSINNYLNGKYLLNKNYIGIKENISNEFILGFRKIDGINKQNFYNKYKIDIKSIDVVLKLLKEGRLLEDKEKIYINPKYIYVSNEILTYFI